MTLQITPRIHFFEIVFCFKLNITLKLVWGVISTFNISPNLFRGENKLDIISISVKMRTISELWDKKLLEWCWAQSKCNELFASHTMETNSCRQSQCLFNKGKTARFNMSGKGMYLYNIWKSSCGEISFSGRSGKTARPDSVLRLRCYFWKKSLYAHSKQITKANL